MKAFLKLLVLCAFMSRAVAASTDEEQIRSRFWELTQALCDYDAESLVAAMQPETVKTYVKFFHDALRERGLPQPAETPSSDEDYVTEVMAEAFRVDPEAFSFQAWDSLHIHGVLRDGEDAFLVYSTESKIPGFRSTATLTFNQDRGEWKLRSMPLTTLILNTWPKKEAEDETPPAVPSGDDAAEKPTN